MKKLGLIALLVFLAVGFVFAGGQAPAETMTLRYAHMNAPNSAAGRQAAKFAELVAEKTGGSIHIEVSPSSLPLAHSAPSIQTSRNLTPRTPTGASNT